MYNHRWNVSDKIQILTAAPYALSRGDLIAKNTGTIIFANGVDRSYAQERLIEAVKDSMRKALIEEHGDFLKQVIKQEQIGVEILYSENGFVWGTSNIGRGSTAPRVVYGIEVTVEWTCISTLLHDQKSNQWKKNEGIVSKVPRFIRMGEI